MAKQLTEKEVAMEASRGESSKQYLDAVRIIKHFKQYDHELAQLFSDRDAEIEQAQHRHNNARKKILARIAQEVGSLMSLTAERTNGTAKKYVDVTGARLQFRAVTDKLVLVDEKQIIEKALILDDELNEVLNPEFEGLVHFVEPKVPEGKWKVNKDGLKERVFKNGEALPDEIAEFVDTHDAHDNFSVTLEEGGAFVAEALKEIRTATGDFVALDSNDDAIELSDEVLAEYD